MLGHLHNFPLNHARGHDHSPLQNTTTHKLWTYCRSLNCNVHFAQCQPWVVRDGGGAATAVDEGGENNSLTTVDNGEVFACSARWQKINVVGRFPRQPSILGKPTGDRLGRFATLGVNFQQIAHPIRTKKSLALSHTGGLAWSGRQLLISDFGRDTLIRANGRH